MIIYVLSDEKSGLVREVSTSKPQAMISTLDEVWNYHDYSAYKNLDVSKVYEAYNLKFALPNVSRYSGGGSFILLHTELQDQSLYDNFVQNQMTIMRYVRNDYLTLSDWTQMADCPISAERKAEWATYRQALRDLPNNTINPYIPFWPTKPE